MIFCIENNHWHQRSSSIQDYYKMGNTIPGIRIYGMNVWAVREGIRFAKEWCGSGNGPIFVEIWANCYLRGQVVFPDPGMTYRKPKKM